jgi:sulfite reductase alpha subunit-like flavoprotein
MNIKKIILVNKKMFSCFSDARNMAHDVHQVVQDVLVECGGKTTVEAENYIKKLQNKGRYSCDVWS